MLLALTMFCAGASIASALNPVSTPNLLTNASFESSADHWKRVNYPSGVNYACYPHDSGYGVGYAHDGSGFLEMNTLAPRGSVAQDVDVSAAHGQSYFFSIWLRAAPGTSPISGTLALWGLGGGRGTDESNRTGFIVGQEWTLVTAPLDIQQKQGHDKLRAEIYINTINVNLDADGALLVNSGLTNASFESSADGWERIDFPDLVNLAQYNNAGYAHDGSGFLEMNTLIPSGSVAQDVTFSTEPGQCYSFSLWLRAAPGTIPISGTLELWGTGGGKDESSSTKFTVGREWTLIKVPLEVQYRNHDKVRAQIYIDTVNANLDADGASLVNAGLKSASFESKAEGWEAVNHAPLVNLAQYRSDTGYPHDGLGFLEMNTLVAGGSVAQDIDIPEIRGRSYSFSVWLRAAPGTNPISGTLALWGLKDGSAQSNGTNFTVGQDWTLVTVPFDMQDSDYKDYKKLRAEIYMNTVDANLDADGAVLRR